MDNVRHCARHRSPDLVWVREDHRGNRFFYSMQFHDTEHGTESDFNYNMLLRAAEYIAGERAGSLSFPGKYMLAPKPFFQLGNGRQLRVYLEGNCGLSVLSPLGQLLNSVSGSGEKTFAPPAFERAGHYILRIESKENNFLQKILIP